MTKKTKLPIRQIVTRVIVAVGVAGTLALFVLVFGRVSGIEFSPSHFDIRQFSVQEIPFLEIQISPVRRDPVSSATVQYLVAQSLIKPPPKGTPTDWQLVELSRGAGQNSTADAKLLLDQLQLEIDVRSTASSNEFWHDWSIKEPAKAKILWPIVQTLAERELYILIPEIFTLAVDAGDGAELQQKADSHLRTSYVELVTEMRASNQPDLANSLLAEAIADYPGEEALQALR